MRKFLVFVECHIYGITVEVPYVAEVGARDDPPKEGQAPFWVAVSGLGRCSGTVRRVQEIKPAT